MSDCNSRGSAMSCVDEGRRDLVRAKQDYYGLDYLEVSADQLTLTVTMLGLAPKSITKDQVKIEGGRRITGIQIVDQPEVRQPDSMGGDAIMIVHVDKPGDYSTYTLRVTAPGFDQRYSSVDFSFKIDCGSGLDCKTTTECAPAVTPAPDIDYLSKDYESFRQLILDRMALTVPDWQEQHVPDIGITLVEILAYVGDQLSYYQDAVATEAYLDTARQRISIRRHARLVDYHLHEGCNARTWMQIQTSQEVILNSSDFYFTTTLPLPQPKTILVNSDLEQIDPSAYEVFQPLDTTLHLIPARNRISFYTWGDTECCLPSGATRATLAGDNKHFGLSAGDFLLIAERIGPFTGVEGDADPTHRQVVRLTKVTPGTDALDGTAITEIEWSRQDALQFALCLSAVGQPSTVVDGKVVDRAGAAIPGATVTAVNNDTSLATTIGTGSDGTFTLINLVPGNYVLTAEKSGIGKTSVPVFALSLGQKVSVTIPLVASSTGDSAQAGDTVPRNSATAGGDPTPVVGGGPTPAIVRGESICQLLIDVSLAYGNIFLADHGGLIRDPQAINPDPELDPPVVPSVDVPRKCCGVDDPTDPTQVAGVYRPKLLRGPLTFSEALRASVPASGILIQDPSKAVPRISLTSQPDATVWTPQADLLNSGPNDADFVVEVDDQGIGNLRFGDGILGLGLDPGMQFQANYRVGCGRPGNVGANTVTQIVFWRGVFSGAALQITNPLPASGGIDPEPVENVRSFAPFAFRQTLKRAITPDDYATVARAPYEPEVRKSEARFLWTGSWYEVDVTVEPLAAIGACEQPALLRKVERDLYRYRRIFHDVRVRTAELVPIDLAISVCVKPGYLRAHVKAALLDLFSNRRLANGTRGFFHPDNLALGQGVMVSRIIALAQAVDGVENVSVTRLRREFENDNGELAAGILPVEAWELPQLDNDPSFPEHGILKLALGGGR